jgi:2'-5' RNA ligase
MELPVSPSLPQRRPSTEGTHFFFALLPDDTTRAQIALAGERFRKSHRLSGTPIDPDDLHVKLCDAGKPERLRQPLESALLAAASEVSIQCFELALDSALRLSEAPDGSYPFVLGVDTRSTEAALALRRVIADAQRRQGLQVHGISSYLPHVTLMRSHGLNGIQETLVPISWTAREFVLMRSFFGQSRLEVIGRWPLRAAPAPERFDLSNLPDLAELDAFFAASGSVQQAASSDEADDASQPGLRET